MRSTDHAGKGHLIKDKGKALVFPLNEPRKQERGAGVVAQKAKPQPTTLESHIRKSEFQTLLF